jgi:hypothetical protein
MACGMRLTHNSRSNEPGTAGNQNLHVTALKGLVRQVAKTGNSPVQ